MSLGCSYHFIGSELPLKSGHSYKAACGHIVSNAEWAWSVDWNAEQPGAEMDGRGACKRCRDRQPQTRYLYAAVEGIPE